MSASPRSSQRSPPSSHTSSDSTAHNSKRPRNDCAGRRNPNSASEKNAAITGFPSANSYRRNNSSSAFSREDTGSADSAQAMAGERKLKKTPRHLSIRNVVPNQASNTCFLQIYGTGFDTGDTVPTVLLFFDQRRFIFNAGEGIQRYCTEHKIKLSKIDHIFLTRVCSETTGGLPGLLLTLAGLGEAGMAAQIWGPGDFQNLVNAIRSFVPNAATVYTHSFGGEGDEKLTAETGASTPILLVEDELVRISSVILCPHADLEDKTSRNVSVVYICELPEVLGKFDTEKALAKGLKPGFKYGKLQRGECVMSDDGTQMVHPEDVLGPSSPGPIMILVDCPSLVYIPALTSASSIQSFYSGLGKTVNCVVHLSPASVTNCTEYQDWMANFKEAQHLMAGRQGEDPGCPILKSSASILSKLNLICPSVFPISGFLSEKQQKPLNQHAPSASTRTIIAENLLKFRFRPITALGLDSSSVPESFDMLAAQKEFARECTEVSEARDYLSQVWNRNTGESLLSPGTHADDESQMLPECIQHASRQEMEIVFLGTGSSQPSKYRNVSAIYVHLFEHGGILLDCGEGTYAQLKRRYGSKGADDVLLNLKCIWISHIHADHHSGLPRILSARNKLLQSPSASIPILVIGPRQLKRFIDAYAMVEDLGMVFLDCSQTTTQAERVAEALKVEKMSKSMVGGCKDLVENTEEINIVKDQAEKLLKQQGFHFQQGVDEAGRETLKSALQSMGLKSLLSIQVVHCLNAYGVVLESQAKPDGQGNLSAGWKLVYSGDTRPCKALIDASHGATVLIHEATFDDSMPVEAIMKNHSITKEAIEVGMSAGVYRIILTHFSQRYPKIPVFDESYTNKTCIAFDMMSVNLADLPVLPKLLPALKMLFQDEMLVEDEVEMTA